jgi:hypothetical protein
MKQMLSFRCLMLQTHIICTHTTRINCRQELYYSSHVFHDFGLELRCDMSMAAIFCICGLTQAPLFKSKCIITYKGC